MVSKNRVVEVFAHPVVPFTRFRSKMTAAGFTISGKDHPICPVMLGDARLASVMAEDMLNRGDLGKGAQYADAFPEGRDSCWWCHHKPSSRGCSCLKSSTSSPSSCKYPHGLPQMLLASPSFSVREGIYINALVLPCWTPSLCWP